MPLNSLLLSVFTKKSKRYSLDVQSVLGRYEALSIIYVNLLVLVLVCTFDAICWLYLAPMSSDIRLVSVCPLIVFSFLLLKDGKEKLAIIASLLFMHSVNLFMGRFLNQQMAALCGQILIVNFSFFLYTSPKSIILNIILCIVQFIGHTEQILKTFEVTMNDEQSFQIHILLVTQFLCLLSLPLLLLVRKSVETNIWKIAQNNYEKSENLTKDILEAVETNDAFLLSLSEEMKKILISVEKSLSHLSQIAQKPNQLEEVNSIKVSISVLLNILNNALDSAKLRSGRMQDTTQETNLADTLRKGFTNHTEVLKWSNTSIQVMIDKSLPQRIWIDSSRVVQIVMNLIFNGLQSPSSRRGVEVYAAWYNESVDRDDLLKPIKVAREDASNNTPDRVINTGLGAHTDRLSTEEMIEEFASAEYQSRLKNFSLIKFPSVKQQPGDKARPTVSWSLLEGQDIRDIAETSQSNANVLNSQLNSERKGYLKIQVIDKRYEIPQSDLTQLFKVPNQATSASQYLSGGIGLRLWVCKQLCLKMGGNIKAECKTNGCTTFMFYISVDNSRFFEPLPQDRRLNRRGKITALIIDENLYDRGLHRILLEKEGAEVTTTCDEKTALEAIRKQGASYFNFVMVGLQMPNLNGFRIVKRIREYERELKKQQLVDICFVSGEHFDENEILREYKMKEKVKETVGIKGLMKPLDIGLLKNTLSKYKGKENA